MNIVTDSTLPVVEAGWSLAYLMSGVKLLGTIVVFVIGKMLEKRRE